MSPDQDERRTTPPPRPKGGRGNGRRLSPEIIIEAAIGLTDEHGVEGLTMRNLGRALGVDPMTIYGYFPDKATLFEAVVESETQRVRSNIGEIPVDPVEALVHLAVHLRRSLLEHPNLAPLVAARPAPAETWPAVVSSRLALLRAAGVDDAAAPRVANALTRFTMGAVMHDATAARLRATMGEDAEAHAQRLTANLARLEGDTTVATALMHRVVDPVAAEEDFAQGFRAMLRGFVAGLGAPAPTAEGSQPDPARAALSRARRTEQS